MRSGHVAHGAVSQGAAKDAGTGRLIPFVRSGARRLASVKAGSALIIVVFVFTLAAAFFPYNEAAGFIRRIGQVLELQDFPRIREIGFQERFESPPFIGLVAVLSLSLCLSLFFRMQAEVRRWRGARRELARNAIRQLPSGPAGDMIAAAKQALQGHGYRTFVLGTDGGWKVHAERGGGGIWGSFLFHIAILLLLGGVVVGATGSFKGSIKLTEGEAFDARVDRLREQHAGRWYTPSAQPLTFRLVRVEPDYEVEGAATVASIVEPTFEGKSVRFFPPVPVYISHGLRHAGVTIHQGRDTGYAPLVKVEDANGKRLLDGYTQLATMSGDEHETFFDYVEIKDRNLRIEMELLPDAVYRGGAYVSRSAAKKNAVLHVIVRELGKPVLDEFLPVTRDVTAGGYSVFFGGVRRWSRLEVGSAPGVPLLIAATLVGAAGLAIRLLRVRRRMVVSLRAAAQGESIDFDVAGSSEKFPRLFEAQIQSVRTVILQRLAALAAPAQAGSQAFGLRPAPAPGGEAADG